MMKSFKNLKLTFLLICIALFSNAGVNLKNGNFYISYTDVMIATQYGAITEITRTYNSKATEIGLFGFGWGSEIETYLYSYPDGSIVIAEHGAGGKTVFTSAMTSDDLLDYMVDQLIDVMIEQGDLENTPNAIISKRENLIQDHENRRVYWNRYANDGLLEYVSNYPVGMEWESFSLGSAKIVKTEDGFRRISASEIEDFNHDGLLVKLDRKNGNWSTLEYSNGHIRKILNADGSFFLFETNEDGYISKIIHEDAEAIFKYDGDDLQYSKDVAGNQYEFSYDESHNMTKIVYNPARFKGEAEDALHIEYHPKTLFTSKITERDGTVTEYEYKYFYNEDGTVNENHYATDVIKTGYSGEKIVNSYEYVIGVKHNGENYTQKIITVINGVRTATTYDELCSNPIEIIKGNRTTTFKYNNRCLLVEKVSDYESITMEYHPTLEKLTYVKSEEGEYKFEYDEKANLIYAIQDNSEWVKLVYNEDSKIVKMIQDKQTLDFVYNKIGKPIKISIENLGSIDVEYNDMGEITSVKSEEGHEMALKVTQAFQNLLSLVKPSGVNFNM